MNKKDCYYLGTIVRTHGLKGDLILKLDTDDPEAYKNLESVFLELNGTLIPFFLEKSILHSNNQLRIKIKDSNINTINSFIGINVYLPLNTLPPLSGTKFYYHEIIGFSLINQQNCTENNIGNIKEIIDNTLQALFVIKKFDEKELIIPIIDSWILKVDRENKILIMELPEGIMDI